MRTTMISLPLMLAPVMGMTQSAPVPHSPDRDLPAEFADNVAAEMT